MKFSIPKSELASAMQVIKPVISNNNVNPILDGIYMEVTKDTLRLMASDSTLQIESNLPVDAQSEGRVVLPGSLFSNITAKLPNEDIDMEMLDSGTGIQLQCGSFQMNLQCMNAEEYPEMPSIENGNQLTIRQHLLKDMIHKTIESVATDQARPILTGLLFEIQEGKLNIVGLSSNRMAIRSENVSANGEWQAVISAKTAMNKVMAALSDDPELDVTILFGTGSALFDMGHTRIHTAYLAGEFLPYRNIIPQQFQNTVHVPRRELNDAIGRAALLSAQDKRFVKLNIGENTLTLSANSEMGFMREEIAIQSSGPNLEIAFNAGFLTDALGRLSDESVCMRFQSPEVAGIIEPEQSDAYFYLIAPVQI